MPVNLPVNRLKKLRDFNPFRCQPWRGHIVKMSDVKLALDAGRLVSVQTNTDHAGRIAYFVVHESADPISIDVGIPAMQYFVDIPLDDGNHRMAAAIYAKRLFISASVAGQMNYDKELFGVDCEETQYELEWDSDSINSMKDFDDC